MMIDGMPNAVDELDAVPIPMGADNPHGNAFTRSATRLATESDAARTANSSVGRTWRISNPDSTNRLDQRVAYELRPEGRPILLADPNSSTARRAAFATKHLWVTRYDPAERFPAGELINQHPGGAGLPEFVAKNRPIDGEDIVVWHPLEPCTSRVLKIGQLCRSSTAASPSGQWAFSTATPPLTSQPIWAITAPRKPVDRTTRSCSQPAQRPVRNAAAHTDMSGTLRVR